MAAPTFSRANLAAREVTKQLVTSADLLLHYCGNIDSLLQAFCALHTDTLVIIPEVLKTRSEQPLTAGESKKVM